MAAKARPISQLLKRISIPNPNARSKLVLAKRLSALPTCPRHGLFQFNRSVPPQSSRAARLLRCKIAIFRLFCKRRPGKPAQHRVKDAIAAQDIDKPRERLLLTKLGRR
jgi:hypothetical protein